MQTLSTKNIYIIGAVAFVLGLLFNFCFFDKQIGLSFFVYVFLLLIALFGLLDYFKIVYVKSALWYLAPILFFSVMIAVRDSQFLIFWNFIVTLGLLLLLANHISGKTIRHYSFFDYILNGCVLPFKMLGKSFVALGRMLTVGKGFKESQKYSQVVKGIFITLPFLIIFILLLSSADLVFSRMLSNIFNFEISPTLTAKIFWTLTFAFIWLGTYFYILENASPRLHDRVPRIPITYRFGKIEAGILFGSLSALSLLFVIIQIKYLFAGQSAITDLGFTYAEYAHKGFGELIAVAVLTFGLIYGADKYIERSERGHFGIFKSLSGVLIALVLIIMASAFLRLNIYEEAYSFTMQRILVQAFIVWLAAVFSWLFYKITVGLQDSSFFFGVIVSVLAFFFVFNCLNPDAFIARKNIEQFATVGKLDTSYISMLSTDATPELIKLLDKTSLKDKYGRSVATSAALALNDQAKRLREESGIWQSYNISRQRALQLINNNWEKISELAKQYYN